MERTKFSSSTRFANGAQASGTSGEAFVFVLLLSYSPLVQTSWFTVNFKALLPMVLFSVESVDLTFFQRYLVVMRCPGGS